MVAIFSEEESQAVSLLKQQGIHRIDIVNLLQGFNKTDVAYDSMLPDASKVVESRLDNLESKVDQILHEIRDLSKKVQLVADKLGPGEKS